MKKWLVLAGLLLVIAIASLMYIGTKQPITQPIDAGLTYEVVSTPEAMQKGLGGRSEVPHNFGMLFVFAVPNTYRIWMKDMLVPIDILWLAEDGTIIGIEESVATSTYPQTYAPPKPVRLVLELRAGEARLKNLHVGSRILLPTELQK